MTGQMSQDPKRSDESREPADTGEYRNAGVGAASALERMKSERARRHKRQHGHSVWPPGEDDRDGRHEKGN